MKYLVTPQSGLQERKEADRVAVKHGVLIGYKRQWSDDGARYRDRLLWAYGAGWWQEVERETA